MMPRNEKETGFDELVFEGRNRNYGAYAIRKSYNERLAASVSGAVIFLALILLVPFITMKHGKMVLEPPIIPYGTVVHPEDYHDHPTIELPGGPVTQPAVNILPRTVRTQVDPIQPLDRHNQTGTGGTVTGTTTGTGTGTNGTGLPITTDIPHVTNTTEIIDFPETGAGFPGGLAAIQKFIQDRFNYGIFESPVQGTVVLTIVIDEEGSIADVKVVKSLDPMADREASRIVKEMPRWTPGKMGNTAVKTRVILPVKISIR